MRQRTVRWFYMYFTSGEPTPSLLLIDAESNWLAFLILLPAAGMLTVRKASLGPGQFC